MKTSLNIFWFRRDLRLEDNAGLYHALRAGKPLLLLFIFDRNILDRLENKKDARVSFIFHALHAMKEKLAGYNATVHVFYGEPQEIFSSLCDRYETGEVFTNEDYEPYARERDEKIKALLNLKGIGFQSFKDQVIFSKQELLKDDGSPYTVFTAYSHKWKALLNEPGGHFLKAHPVEKYMHNLYQQSVGPFPELSSIGFCGTDEKFPDVKPNPDLIRAYGKLRDYPGLDATSHLGIHLRFGTISIRRLTEEAEKLSDVFLNELIWRDFYHMILWHFPRVGKGYAFKPAYEKIKWINNEKDFAHWCAGTTGYPMVDAGMRQLNETGFMHNRVRMVTASFLAKHLLIDWRWGEAYFAEKLLDFDLASNNGGWQWAAGCGCDAAPYFRIFNPSLQQKKFDPDGTYIKRWLPDYQELGYPEPIVEHVFARDRAIRVYKEALTVYG
jgi:deoxyribodipyrimidine photo-lyase